MEDALPSTTLDGPQRVKRLCNSTVTTFNLPSLPKLHGNSTLVTTKLCEQVYKSITPNKFDLSIPKKNVTSTLLEYNSLQDPHLKSYFHHPPRKNKLTKNGFVNEDLEVVCSLKKYNAYRHFLEDEFMKIHQQKREDIESNACRDKKIVEQVIVDERDERELKRLQFFQKQENRLRMKQQRLRQLANEEEKTRQSIVEQKRLLKEQAEMRREAELEEKKMNKLRKQYEESFRRKSLIDQVQTEEYLRLLQLHKMKKLEQMKHKNELEERWEVYERHAQLVSREEERKMKEREREKDKKLQKRERLFKIIQKREEEKKQKIHDDHHNQVLLLQEKADEFENHWKKVHNDQIMECREMMQKPQDHLKITPRRQTRPVLAYSSRPYSATVPSLQMGRYQDKKRVCHPSPQPSENIQKLLSLTSVLEVADSDSKIVVESISTDCIENNGTSKDEIKETLLVSSDSVNSSHSDIDSMFSCEVQSSSSKSKSVRFDIPEQKVNS